MFKYCDAGTVLIVAGEALKHAIDRDALAAAAAAAGRLGSCSR